MDEFSNFPSSENNSKLRGFCMSNAKLLHAGKQWLPNNGQQCTRIIILPCSLAIPPCNHHSSCLIFTEPLTIEANSAACRPRRLHAPISWRKWLPGSVKIGHDKQRLWGRMVRLCLPCNAPRMNNLACWIWPTSQSLKAPSVEDCGA